MNQLSQGHAAAGQAADVRRFFSAFAPQWDSLYGGKRNLFWRVFDHVLRRDVYERYKLTFEALGEDLSGLTVLDVGCGSGIYSFEAARRGAARVVGIDVADDMIALAQSRRSDERDRGACEFIATEFPSPTPLPALSAPFDHAIVMGVMDYVENAGTFLTALRPLVRRTAVLSFPGRHWLRGPLRQYRYQVLGRCAVHNYEEAAIRDACLRAGFRQVSIRRLNHSGICYIVTAGV